MTNRSTRRQVDQAVEITQQLTAYYEKKLQALQTKLGKASRRIAKAKEDVNYWKQECEDADAKLFADPHPYFVENHQPDVIQEEEAAWHKWMGEEAAREEERNLREQDVPNKNLADYIPNNKDAGFDAYWAKVKECVVEVEEAEESECDEAPPSVGHKYWDADHASYAPDVKR